MPLKEFVPPKIYAQLDDGAIVEFDNDKPLSELTEMALMRDFVRVVRCKDCKYYKISKLKKDYTPDKRYKPSVCTIGQFARSRKPEWFCADWKRK